VDGSARRVYRIADGRVAPSQALSGRVRDILVHLIDNRGRDLRNDDLMKAVLPRVVVEGYNFNDAVTVLGRAPWPAMCLPRVPAVRNFQNASAFAKDRDRLHRQLEHRRGGNSVTPWRSST
jgi:hypothetical protein